MHTNDDIFSELNDMEIQGGTLEELKEFEANFCPQTLEDLMEFAAKVVLDRDDMNLQHPKREIDSTPPYECHGTSVRITIRIPSEVLNSFKTESVRQGVGYQTLMIRKLREATSSFNAASLIPRI